MDLVELADAIGVNGLLTAEQRLLIEALRAGRVRFETVPDSRMGWLCIGALRSVVLLDARGLPELNCFHAVAIETALQAAPRNPSAPGSDAARRAA